MLAGKIYDGKKKSYQRRQWLEKRRKRKRKRRNNIDQNQKHRNVSNGGSNGSTIQSVSTSILPPLCWSSSSLMCHLKNEHHVNKNCLDSHWKWSPSRTNINSTTILLANNKQILFHPRTSSSTQVILADQPLPLNGKHYWEIYVPAVYGTSIMFGIASKLTVS